MATEKKKGFFSRLKEGLFNNRSKNRAQEMNESELENKIDLQEKDALEEMTELNELIEKPEEPIEKPEEEERVQLSKEDEPEEKPVEEAPEEVKKEETGKKDETREEVEAKEEIKKEEIKAEGKVKNGFFARLKEGLTKTRNSITEKVDQVLKTFRKVDEELFEELEEALITADIGVNTSVEIINRLRDLTKERKISDSAEVKALLKEIIADMLADEKSELNVSGSPSVIMVIGVNGVGKTTSIAKIAYKLKNSGKKVLLAAGDTFRAAAIDQLEVWGERVGVDVIKHQEGADPAAVIYDAIQAAKSRKMDVVICDTAGRLHTKKNLMDELRKVFKVIDRELPESSREVLLVLDATTGQNAVSQAKLFSEVAEVTGIVLTKLDGTAKGGIVIAIKAEQNIPVKLIGVGEKIDDLQEFDPKAFADALFAD
ncbi:MAG: signal recognition particle-docking protein FtsY [Clostridiaceae bacterium]|nr:signal recognition particle-docking protein FtsY [Clostridiaceae bacterium]